MANKRGKASPYIPFTVQRALPRTEFRFHSRMAGTRCVCSQHWRRIQQRFQVEDLEVTPMKTEMRKTGIDRFGPEKRTSDARGIVWAMAAGTSVETEGRGRRGARGADGRGGNPGFGRPQEGWNEGSWERRGTLRRENFAGMTQREASGCMLIRSQETKMETPVAMHRATEARRNIAPSLAPFCVMEGQANDQNHQQRCSSQNYRQQSSALYSKWAHRPSSPFRGCYSRISQHWYSERLDLT
jgi:hypothetical protein